MAGSWIQGSSRETPRVEFVVQIVLLASLLPCAYPSPMSPSPHGPLFLLSWSLSPPSLILVLCFPIPFLTTSPPDSKPLLQNSPSSRDTPFPCVSQPRHSQHPRSPLLLLLPTPEPEQGGDPERPNPTCAPLPSVQHGRLGTGMLAPVQPWEETRLLPHPSHQEIGPPGPELPLLLPRWAKPGPWALQRERLEESLEIINPGMSRAEPSCPMTPCPPGPGRTLKFLPVPTFPVAPPPILDTDGTHPIPIPPQNCHPRMKLQSPTFPFQGFTLIPAVPFSTRCTPLFPHPLHPSSQPHTPPPGMQKGVFTDQKKTGMLRNPCGFPASSPQRIPSIAPHRRVCDNMPPSLLMGSRAHSQREFPLW